MTKIYHSLLALIASATESELAKYVEYLKAENRVLRARLPKQVHTRPQERERLLKFGKTIGWAVEELITIASPATFYRWIRREYVVRSPNRTSNSGSTRFKVNRLDSKFFRSPVDAKQARAFTDHTASVDEP
jgi:putative transposase